MAAAGGWSGVPNTAGAASPPANPERAGAAFPATAPRSLAERALGEPPDGPTAARPPPGTGRDRAWRAPPDRASPPARRRGHRANRAAAARFRVVRWSRWPTGHGPW